MERINDFFLIRWIRQLFTVLLIVPIKLYQWVISPVLPKTCRYQPTCSEYAIESLRVHGPVRGLFLGTKRILSCHPWGGHGYDPVPPKGAPIFTIKRKKTK
ncbi:MAG TPA: membrane protein insertion efficiency factor YidD [Bacteroides sp.]|nr:membrane protein insertion efficiency factor YidD [Bacteroides sp.]